MAEKSTPADCSPLPPVLFACPICGELVEPSRATCVVSPLRVYVGGGVFAADSMIVCRRHAAHELVVGRLPRVTRWVGACEVYRRAEERVRHAAGRPPLTSRELPVRRAKERNSRRRRAPRFGLRWCWLRLTRLGRSLVRPHRRQEVRMK